MYETSNRKKLRNFIKSQSVDAYTLSELIGKSSMYLMVISSENQYKKHGDISVEKYVLFQSQILDVIKNFEEDFLVINQDIKTKESAIEQKDAEENNQDLKANIFFIMAIAVIIIAAIYLIFVK